MAQGDATSADVPGRYDVVIDGKGYVLLQSLEPSLPFRTHRALYSSSPTFVDRSNVSNAYGDNAQDFFLTVRQRDWSLGEQQKYYRTNQDGRYWIGQNVDVTVPGQVTLAPAVTTVSFSGSVLTGARETQSYKIVVADSTNLYRVAEDGTVSSLGAHGLGAAPGKYAMVTDGLKNYFAVTGHQIRTWDGSVFASFSGSGVDVLEFLNNTLYGYANSFLVKYDTAGNQSVVFQFKGADGTATGATFCRLHSFGGKLLILTAYGQEAAELWIYDGAGCARLEVFPENFVASDLEVLYGVAYIGGSFLKPNGTTSLYTKPTVLFYDGSQLGKLWEANAFNTTSLAASTFIKAVSGDGPNTALGVSSGRLIFTDETTGNLMAYNPALGGVSTIGTFTPNTGNGCRIISTGQIQLHIRNQTTGYFLPASTYPSSGYVVSSLIDFDNSLTKLFRGIKVEFDSASDGNGGSVDIAYQTDSLVGAWTTLQTGAVSGTEYTLSNISGHSIAIRITLNKGTSTSGPTLKAVNVRGAPILTRYKEATYILDLSGIGRTDSGARLADGTEHPLNGHQQADNLRASIAKTSTVQVSDRFTNQQTSLNGTTTSDSFTAMFVPADCEIYDVREGWDNPQYPGGYVAKISVREV